ncbi:MAG: DUF4355 domain-containing protein [Candidatus Ornithomonoglobus sp.]
MDNNVGTDPKLQGGAEPTATEGTPQNAGAAPTGTESGAQGGGTEPPAPTTYSQEDLDKAVADAVAKANTGVEERIATAVAEAQRLAALPDKDRKAEEDRIERENFAREKAKFAAEKLKLFAERELTAAGLPVSFADMVAAGDEASTKARIDSISKDYKSAVDAGVAQRMKGTPPRGGAGTNAGGGTKTLQDEINAAMKMNI